jgi:hypothetical protein
MALSPRPLRSPRLLRPRFPNSRKIIAQSVFTIGIAGSIPKQDCIRQTFGPKLVEIHRHKPLCPARDRADRRPSSLCRTFNLPIEDQAPVYDGSVTLSKRANINGAATADIAGRAGHRALLGIGIDPQTVSRHDGEELGANRRIGVRLPTTPSSGARISV